jgi:hypothetical protein
MRIAEQSTGGCERVPSQVWDTTSDGLRLVDTSFLFGLFRFSATSSSGGSMFPFFPFARFYARAFFRSFFGRFRIFAFAHFDGFFRHLFPTFCGPRRWFHGVGARNSPEDGGERSEDAEDCKLGSHWVDLSRSLLPGEQLSLTNRP